MRIPVFHDHFFLLGMCSISDTMLSLFTSTRSSRLEVCPLLLFFFLIFFFYHLCQKCIPDTFNKLIVLDGPFTIPSNWLVVKISNNVNLVIIVQYVGYPAITDPPRRSRIKGHNYRSSNNLDVPACVKQKQKNKQTPSQSESWTAGTRCRQRVMQAFNSKFNTTEEDEKFLHWVLSTHAVTSVLKVKLEQLWLAKTR